MRASAIWQKLFALGFAVIAVCSLPASCAQGIRAFDEGSGGEGGEGGGSSVATSGPSASSVAQASSSSSGGAGGGGGGGAGMGGAGGAPGCALPEVDCGGVCTDTASDAMNCGACGVACGAGQI